MNTIKVDYIVVGFGLAGMAFITELEKRNKSFIAIDNNEDKPSRIIGGMFNPIILKRFTPAWNAHKMWNQALPFYKEMEAKFKKKYIFFKDIYRILHSVEEQNNWMVASDKEIMSQYMQPKILKENIKGLRAPYGYGKIQGTGQVDGTQLLADYKLYLLEKNLFVKEYFEYDELVVKDTHVSYKSITADKVIFSEGSYLPNNPFFNYLPMKSAKGELLLLKIKDLDVDKIIKSGVFLVPEGNDTYIVGATYNWNDKTFEPTDDARDEIERKLQKFLDLPYTILDTKVGIRPTIKDRRPLIGVHPEYANLAILNGLGTRGIIIAPSIANYLISYLEDNKEIPKEMNCNRFEQKPI